jgi:hypothetical protein
VNVVELVEATDDLLTEHRVPHAYGGALALGYHAAPRATMDVDVNVFVPFGEAAPVVAALESIGLAPERPLDEWVPIAGGRLVQGSGAAVVDLFFSVDEQYEQILKRCVRRPFGNGRRVSVHAAEDLAVFKLSFGRSKDWVDLEALVKAQPDLDLDVVESTLVALRGKGTMPRIARLRAMAAAV